MPGVRPQSLVDSCLFSGRRSCAPTWEPHVHRCAQVTTGGFGPHASSKRTHYAPREIETQPDARNLALSCAPRAPISFEQARQLVGVEANTAITDTKLNHARINTHCDVDRRCGRRIFHGIRQQVAYHAIEGDAIPLSGGVLAR